MDRIFSFLRILTLIGGHPCSSPKPVAAKNQHFWKSGWKRQVFGWQSGDTSVRDDSPFYQLARVWNVSMFPNHSLIEAMTFPVARHTRELLWGKAYQITVRDWTLGLALETFYMQCIFGQPNKSGGDKIECLHRFAHPGAKLNLQGRLLFVAVVVWLKELQGWQPQFVLEHLFDLPWWRISNWIFCRLP